MFQVKCSFYGAPRPACAERRSEFCVCEELQERCSKSSRVSRLDDQCRLTIANDLGNTADARGHVRLSRGHGFDRRKAEGLVPYRREDDDVGVSKNAWDMAVQQRSTEVDADFLQRRRD